MRITGRLCLTSTLPIAAVALLTGCGTDSGGTAQVPAQQIVAPQAAQSSPAQSGTAQSGTAQPTAGAGPADTLTLTRDEDYRNTQSGTALTIVCNGGGDITIDADDVRLRVTGECEDIEIDGSGNDVVVELADELEIDGNSNAFVGGTIRTVDVDGNDNSVRVLSTREIDVEGNANTVTYSDGNPDIDNEGDNTIGVG